MFKKILIIVSFLVSLLAAAEIDKYTNQDTIALRGLANKNVMVDIYVNEKKVKTVKSDENGEWLAADVPLKTEGFNNIYALARNEEGTKSKISAKLNVFFDQTPPAFYDIKVEPQEAKPGDLIKISLKSDEDTERITLVMPDNSLLRLRWQNGFWQGEWRVPQIISGGAYALLITAEDKAANTAQQSFESLFIDALPSLAIVEPLDGAIVYRELIPVKGQARNSMAVVINNERAQVMTDFSFSGTAQLKDPGRNKILVQSYDRAGALLEAEISVVRLVTFDDIQQHTARREIEYLATLGFVEAYPHSRLFKPDSNITRAELAALLVRIKDLPLVYSEKSSFKDINSYFWAQRYIETASKYGIVEGYPGNVYKPQGNVTRAEAAAMLVRFGSLPVSPVNGDVALDVSAKHWGADHIATFKAAGLMPASWQEERFYPSRYITRAEVCAALARIPEINRVIEEMLGSKTAWDYRVDDTRYYEPGQSVVQNSAQPISEEFKGESEPTVSKLMIGVVSPLEVVAGRDIRLTVASLEKMKAVSALFPDGAELPLIYDRKTDLWEVSWRVPDTLKISSYNIMIKGNGIKGENYNSYSNYFSVVETLAISSAPVTMDTKAKQEQLNKYKIIVDDDVEFTYPEFYMVEEGIAPETLSVPTAKTPAIKQEKSLSGEQILTRAAMSRLLGRYGKLRQAKVVAAPAQDVPLNHPDVRYIKSAIVTGIIPNKKPGKFFPNDSVTRAEAQAVLRRAKIINAAAQSGQEPITETEFDSWLSESVK